MLQSMLVHELGAGKRHLNCWKHSEQNKSAEISGLFAFLFGEHDLMIPPQKTGKMIGLGKRLIVLGYPL